MKLADYSDRVTADQLDTALRLGGFEGVFHYLSGNNALRIELPDVVATIRQRGWPQAGIDVPTLSAVDGQAAARAARAYGFGAGFRLYLDIEPDEFRANPPAWAQAANAWCNDVRAAGFSPGPYGTDATVATCASNADTIWRAKPGMCDPAGAGLDPAFFAGRRAVQCGQENHNGVSFDVSYSQFAVGGDMTQEQAAQLAYLFQQWNPGGDPANKTLRDYFGDIYNTVAGLPAAKAELDALKAEIDKLAPTGTVDLSAVYSRLDALGKHLGLGTA